jgi:hypothetical protein
MTDRRFVQMAVDLAEPARWRKYEGKPCTQGLTRFGDIFLRLMGELEVYRLAEGQPF